MVTYIYFVKCPNCEDEYFDFFDEAKGYAMSCLGQKPIITQTEVNRNDFGECTDHCDLGTVWSWEDAIGKETEAEPTVSVFTKDDLAHMANGEDPEFDNLDNSVNFEIDEVSNNIINEANLSGAFANDIDADILSELAKGVPEEPITKPSEKCSKSAPRNALYYVQQGEEVTFYLGNIKLPQRQITHCWITHNGEVLQTRNIRYPNDLKTKFSIDLTPGDVNKAIIDIKNLVNSINGVNESCSRKPIPEGMTIEELVEAMEENEDTVECTKCGGLFEKAKCHHNNEGFGWCCESCGSTESLEEAVAEELSFEELVKDSINHLVNSLGKDPWADGFGDEVLSDIENNYDVDIPDVMDKYNSWASAVMSEVSRQVNRDYKLDEEVSEVADLGNEFDGNYPANFEDEEARMNHLSLCPECGKETFDINTGVCESCGF